MIRNNLRYQPFKTAQSISGASPADPRNQLINGNPMAVYATYWTGPAIWPLLVGNGGE